MPSIRLRRLLVLASLAATAAGCILGENVSPEATTALWLRLSTDSVAGVTVTLAVLDTAPAPGSAVRMVATATNATPRRLRIGTACGPSFDVQVTMPSGERRSVLRDALTEEGAFDCRVLPEHFVSAGASRSLVMRWSTPATPGDYVARAGLRREDGLANLSAPVTISVR